LHLNLELCKDFEIMLIYVNTSSLAFVKRVVMRADWPLTKETATASGRTAPLMVFNRPGKNWCGSTNTKIAAWFPILRMQMQSFHDDLSKLKTKTDQNMVSCKQLGVFCTTESMKVKN